MDSKRGGVKGTRPASALGKATGPEKGYRSGYTKGSRYRNGFVAGCQEVFDELDTNRVFDRQAGPYETYWYPTRDQCT